MGGAVGKLVGAAWGGARSEGWYVYQVDPGHLDPAGSVPGGPAGPNRLFGAAPTRAGDT